VKRFALEHGLDVLQPTSLKSEEALGRIRDARADALVVAAYGLIIPADLLGAARHGAFNIHASLLPRWRGAAPIQRALMAGDAQTGISIMQMDAGLDTGPVLLQQAIPITDEDDAGTLHDKLAALGARLMLQALEQVAAGTAVAVPQPAEGATYAKKIGKDDTRVDWSLPAARIERTVRALRPSPGLSTVMNAEPVKIWRARLESGQGAPGTVLAVSDEGILVACGSGALRLTELQRAGGKRLASADFLRGRTLDVGTQLG